jgi:hypothetical protein
MNAGNVSGRERSKNVGADNAHYAPYFYPNRDSPSLYHYVPGTPHVQHSTDGTPQLNLITSNNFAMFQLTTEWDMDQVTLERFRTAVAEQEGAPPAQDIRFAPAPYDVEKVTLLIANARGELQSVATANPSGFGNNAAVFNLQLDAEQKAQVIAALRGEPDLVQVIYDVRLKRTQRATTRIQGELIEEVMDVRPDEELETLRQRIESAIDEGHLTLQHEVSEGASETLREAADDAALTSAAEALRHLARESRDESAPLVPESTAEEKTSEEWTIEIEETVKARTVEHLRPVTDASDWLSGGDISNHLQVF